MFKVTKEILPTHHAKLVVEFAPEAVERAKRRVARKLSQQTRVPGFRPGKAPYGVVVRHFGETVVREELLDTLLDEYYGKILEEAEVKPALPGQVKQVVSWEPLVVEIEVPLEPEVDLGDYKALRVPYEPPQVDEEEVEQALENLRRMHVRMETVDRPAQVGDVVQMKLKGKYTPPAKEGETPETRHIPEEEVSLLVKDDEDPEEWPFPGFSKQLEGAKKGDKLTLSYTYPEDAENESMRGYTFEYEVEVLEVQTPVYPDITDEFVKEHTEYETVEDLRKGIRANLEEDRRSQYDREYREKVLEALVAQSQVRYPQAMLETMLQDRLEEIRRYLAQRDVDLEEYLKEQGKTLEEFQEELKGEVEEDLIQELVLDAFVKAEGIEVNQEEVEYWSQRVLVDMLQAQGKQLTEAEIRRLLRRERGHFEYHLQDVLSRYLHAKGLERLAALARGEDEATSEAEETAADARDAAPAEEEATEVETVQTGDAEPEASDAPSQEGEQAQAEASVSVPESSKEGGQA